MEDLLLPLFLLQVVLLPEEPLPLHIFEERYRRMIEECLEAKAAGVDRQEFGVVLAQENEIRRVGCSARIVNLTRKYPDGRMDILTVGRRRFEILYTNSRLPYLRGGVEYFEDDTGHDLPSEKDAQQAIELFREAIRHLRKSSDMPIHLPRPYRYLSFRIAASLPLEVEFKQQLLPLRNETERLKQVIRAMELLTAQLELVEKAQAKGGGNGNPLARD